MGTNKNEEKHNDIYALFDITDAKKVLFNKMEKEWSVVPENNEIKSYEHHPINVTFNDNDNEVDG